MMTDFRFDEPHRSEMIGWISKRSSAEEAEAEVRQMENFEERGIVASKIVDPYGMGCECASPAETFYFRRGEGSPKGCCSHGWACVVCRKVVQIG
jgi:hypothetical protein